jgi:hypothetical protein
MKICSKYLYSDLLYFEIVNNDFSKKSLQNHRTGVDVMITIFCDFCQFSAKKLVFFSKTNVMIKILHNFALFKSKMQVFLLNFSPKIFKKS